MIRTKLIGLAILLLSGTVSAYAEDTLLFGCAVMYGGGGIEVVFSEGTAPIPLADGSTLRPSSLMGMRCAAALRLLLDNNVIHRDQVAASSHLIINTERQEVDPATGKDVDVPDCLIWDIDSAEVTRQLICDVVDDGTIVGQESAISTGSSVVPRNYVGWRCLDALADLGGLSNVVRTSVIRPRQTPLRQRSPSRISSRPGSVIFYQLTLKVP